MAKYRGNVEAIKALVRETEVHRDVYIDEEVFAARDGAPVRQHLGLCRPRQPGAEARRLFRHHHRHAAGADGAPHRRHREGAAQPLPAQGHAHHHRDLRQYRQLLPLPLSRLDLPDRRLAARDPAAQGLREHRLRAEPRRARHERRCATCTTIAASSSPSSTTSARASRNSSARACRASTT